MLTTAWLESLRRGESPSARDLREHLLAVHRLNAGFTESCALRCRDAAGRTSYDWLADVIDPARHGRVLDVACGSGVLLALCHRRHQQQVALSGVDMSADELALARARLGAAPVTLHRGLAQKMDHLASGTIDAVLCHWALTLMDPVEPVLREIERVLARGGVFAAIIDGPGAAAPGYDALHDIIYGHVQRQYPRYGAVDLGDARVRSASPLADLAREVFASRADVTVEPGVVEMSASAEVLARDAAGFFYASFALDREGHARMLADLTDHFAETAATGASGVLSPPRFAMPINRLVIRCRQIEP